MSKPMQCKRCGSLDLLDNNGMDAHSTLHGGTLGVENWVKGHPIGAAIGLTVAAIGLLAPKKLTCKDCGHTFRG